MKKSGFTLAEVLITLSIIGVVSAITLPQLTTNHMQKTMETRLTKFYSSLVNAMDSYAANEDVESIIEVSGFTPANFVNSTFKRSGTCANATDAGCFASIYKTIENANFYANANAVTNALHTTSGAIYKLADGTVFSVGYPAANTTTFMDVTVDLNGSQGPNKVGLDLWNLRVNLSTGDIGDRP